MKPAVAAAAVARNLRRLKAGVDESEFLMAEFIMKMYTFCRHRELGEHSRQGENNRRTAEFTPLRVPKSAQGRVFRGLPRPGTEAASRPRSFGEGFYYA